MKIYKAKKLIANGDWWKTLIPKRVTLSQYTPEYVWLGFLFVKSAK
jgi:hypothetical protein